LGNAAPGSLREFGDTGSFVLPVVKRRVVVSLVPGQFWDVSGNSNKLSNHLHLEATTTRPYHLFVCPQSQLPVA